MRNEHKIFIGKENTWKITWIRGQLKNVSERNQVGEYRLIWIRTMSCVNTKKRGISDVSYLRTICFTDLVVKGP
jgi:hypothetical protein